MSLENAPTLADCLPVPSKSVLSSPVLAEKNSKDLTLEQVLADRFQVWTKVNEVIEKLTPLQAYQGDIHALQKLQQLHLLCNILSPMHSALHACCSKIGLVVVLLNIPHSSARRTFTPSSSHYCGKEELFLTLRPKSTKVTLESMRPTRMKSNGSKNKSDTLISLTTTPWT
ncbi:hypothetical protein PF008_g14899 [Phytophthora fragariae]|uniref:Uncharacterized protein n=1 Tax=Phytophthora fragariae TaxID=53985 RepID=A0A6G0RFM6_9STRA|nr:hypothetical protein PF008_g14899 [Phytophthora fragariae]